MYDDVRMQMPECGYCIIHFYSIAYSFLEYFWSLPLNIQLFSSHKFQNIQLQRDPGGVAECTDSDAPYPVHRLVTPTSISHGVVYPY